MKLQTPNSQSPACQWRLYLNRRSSPPPVTPGRRATHLEGLVETGALQFGQLLGGDARVPAGEDQVGHVAARVGGDVDEVLPVGACRAAGNGRRFGLKSGGKFVLVSSGTMAYSCDDIGNVK